ncbi:MAG: type II restriction endonuclease [Planctomycetaceae bacterium]|nr:type II restriction endonuclease [Planctomycetaceae bacterium]
MPKNQLIRSASDLVTPHDKTRAGFVAMALEKNNMATPYIEEARALRNLASRAKNPRELLKFEDIRSGLLAASGLSEKAQNHLIDKDKTLVVKEFIEKFLLPASNDFADELVYRYLLTKGDALGGKARNLAGVLGERKFLRSLLSILKIAGISVFWQERKRTSTDWNSLPADNVGVENRIKAIFWQKNRPRILILNSKIPAIGNSVDLTVCEGSRDIALYGKESILNQPERMIALGELKGGIDPAGADEHWKTANSALNRIRNGFKKIKKSPLTFFIGAAIEKAMAEEIFHQLDTGVIQNAANLTNDEQLTAICHWLINL